MKMSAYHKNSDFQFYGDFTNVCIQIQEREILIPNVFSPVEDEAATGFVIKGLETLADNNFQIVNKWGREVFRGRNYKNNWTAEGLKEGSYFYLLMLKETEDAEWKVFKGYVMLLRRKNNINI